MLCNRSLGSRDGGPELSHTGLVTSAMSELCVFHRYLGSDNLKHCETISNLEKSCNFGSKNFSYPEPFENKLSAWGSINLNTSVCISYT